VKFLIMFSVCLFRRDEVAECSVEAYDHLPISVAKKMLMFTSDQELLDYISEVPVILSSALCHMCDINNE
jgi:26S proteasome regulatory subunit N12